MKVHILVVDNDVEVARGLAGHYRGHGFRVDQVLSGHAALERMAEDKVDVVLCDLAVPGMDGMEFLRAAKKQYPMTHFIMTGDQPNLDNALACMRLGADTIVFKPIGDTAPLDEAIEKAVESVRTWLEILNQLRELKPTH